MNTAIGAYDAATRTVSATFTLGEIVHIRDVNACHDEGGLYDPAATKLRVDDVARGVATKIAVGAIAMPVEMALPELLLDEVADGAGETQARAE